MRIKVIIGIGAFIIVVVATTALFIRGKQHPMEFPKSSWAPSTRGTLAIPAAAGNADPPSALAAILLDASKGDGEKILSDLSPAMREKLQRQFGKQIQAQGISLAQLVSQMSAHWSVGVGGFHVVNQQVVSEDQVTLNIQPQGKSQPQTFKLKRIDGEWKLDDFAGN